MYMNNDNPMWHTDSANTNQWWPITVTLQEFCGVLIAVNMSVWSTVCSSEHQRNAPLWEESTRSPHKGQV